MDVGLSLLPCLTSPLRISRVLDPQQLPSKSHQTSPSLPLTFLKATAKFTVWFSSTILNPFHWRDFSFRSINSYPTIMIAVRIEWQRNGRRAVEERQRGDKCELRSETVMSLSDEPNTPRQLFHTQVHLQPAESNLRLLLLDKESQSDMFLSWHDK